MTQNTSHETLLLDQDVVADTGFADTLWYVIAEPGQLDSVGTLLWNDAANPASLTGPNATAYAEALTAANGILDGQISDPTGGAVFFRSNQWFEADMKSGQLIPTVSIGNINFLKEP